MSVGSLYTAAKDRTLVARKLLIYINLRSLAQDLLTLVTSS